MGATRGKKEERRIISKALRRLAFERDLEGSYIIADHVIGWAKQNGWDGPVPHRGTIADYLRGKAFPSREFIALFTEALQLTEIEEHDLAYTFTYPFAHHSRRKKPIPSPEEPITAGIGSPRRREDVQPLVEPRRIRGPERRSEDIERLESLTRAAFEDAAKRRAAADAKIGRELEEVEINPQRSAFLGLAEFLKRLDKAAEREDAETEPPEATIKLTADQKRLYDEFLSNLVALALEHAKKGEGLPLSDNFPPEALRALREDDAETEKRY
jgi:hypothetical protein